MMDCKRSSDPELGSELHSMDSNDLIDAMTEEANMTQRKFDRKYGRIPDDEKTCVTSVREWCQEKCMCSKQCCIDFLTSQLPVINVIRTYKPRQYLLGDVFSGVSLGILNIPQGMGYALLAACAPIYGIYTSMFVPLVYVLFGTSRHIAMGVMALSSLLVADVIKRETIHLQEQIETATGNDTAILEEQLAEESFQICVLLALLSGILCFLMGVLRLGFITDYLGDAFLGGFLAGANVRVLTSQMIQLLQISVHPYIGPLSFIYTAIDLFRNIRHSNVASIIIAVSSLVIILVMKYAVNERFKSKLKVPIPIDFIMVVIVTVVCYFGQLESRFGVRIIKHIPNGVPKPSVPAMERSADFLLDALILALVGYILCYMMVKVFSQRHHYTCDPNQEFKAMGICNVVGGFFSCLPSSTSPPRCFLMEQTGGKTQFANVLSGLVVMVFLFFAGPLLEPMPVCILNVLIIAASIPLFMYYKLGYLYWHTNKYDCAIWLVTFVSMITLTINLSIMCGITFSIITVVYRTQRSYSSLLKPVNQSHVLVNPDKYSRLLTDTNGIRIFYFSSPLYFATLSNFKQNLFSLTVPPSALKIVQDVDSKSDSLKVNGISEDPDGDANNDVKMSTPLTNRKAREKSAGLESNTEVHKIIIDASAMTFLDTGGAKTLALLRAQYENIGVEFLVAGCNELVRQQLVKVAECKDMCEKALYPSVQDAINS